MSDPEEHARDILLSLNLAAAHNDGAAQECKKCDKVFHDDDLEEINEKVFCADCADMVCPNCGDDRPEDLWWTPTWCDDCREEL